MPRLSDSARDLLILLSSCAQGAAAWHLLEALLDEQALWSGCLELMASDQLESTSRGGNLRLKHGPQAIKGARARLLQMRWIKHLLEVCQQIPSAAGIREGACWFDYIPHLECLTTRFLKQVPDADLGWPFVALSRLCEAQADRPQSMYWSARALAILQARLGPDHPDTATAYNNLAAAYHQAAHHAQAEELYLQALRIREQQLGREHPYLVNVLSNLAGACRSQGKLELSLNYLQRASSIAGSQSLPVLLQLAETYAQIGDLERALSVCRQALAQSPAEDPNRAFLLQNMGSVLHKSGHAQEAHVLFQQALELQRAHLGSHHPAIATLLNNWGVLFYLDGELARSDQLLTEALQIRLQSLGPRSAETRATAANLAAVRQLCQEEKC
ncbi:tetratricopeptide repeat protein [bacterium]|nr:tetratricopeptide repeat protein [bacterium]